MVTTNSAMLRLAYSAFLGSGLTIGEEQKVRPRRGTILDVHGWLHRTESGTGPVLGGGEGDSRQVCPQVTVRSMLDGMAGMRHPKADTHTCAPRAETVLC